MSVEINQAVAQSGRRKFKSLRWWMLALFLLGVTVNYITRNSLGILAPELKTSLNMSTEQYARGGVVQLAYTVFQPICGWLIDVIGLKMGFLICASIWAVVCMLHAGAGSWLQLAILRFMGARRRRPPGQRQGDLRLVPEEGAADRRRLGGRRFFSIGAMLAPPIIVIAHVSFGWQGAFLFSGGLALIWVVLWWAVLPHSPQQHPNLASKSWILIREDNEPVLPKLPFLTSLASLCKNKKFYGIAIPAFRRTGLGRSSAWVLCTATERGMDLKQIAMFASLPFPAADIGSVASGYLTTLYRNGSAAAASTRWSPAR